MLCEHSGKVLMKKAKGAVRGAEMGRVLGALIKAERAECANPEPKINMRHILTDLQGEARHIYERIYCGRGARRTS